MRQRTAVVFIVLWLGSPGYGADCGDSRMSQAQAYFAQADFPRAVTMLERALRADPDCAGIEFWLGKALVRRADVSSPVFAGKHARKARTHLERALELDPHNRECVVELFDLYVESPEYFHGSLERAASLLESSALDVWTAEALRSRLAASRREHRGRDWQAERTVIWMIGPFGYAVPWL
jgi:Tfp pilus assembly protein PilF